MIYVSTLVIFAAATLFSQGVAFSKCGKCRQYLVDFPGFIPCIDVSRRGLEGNESGECVIKKNGKVAFEETILLMNGKGKGLAVDKMTYEDWQNATIERMLTFQNQFSQCTFQICLEASIATRGRKRSSGPGEEKMLSCRTPRILNGKLSEKQKDSMTTVWKKNEQVIGHYNSSFHELIIENVTYESSGNYSCFIAIDGREILMLLRHLCVKAPPMRAMATSIQSIKSTYEGEPGGSVVLKCSGMEIPKDGYAATVYWMKNDSGNQSLVCKLYQNHSEGNCVRKSLQKGTICYGPPTVHGLKDYLDSRGRYEMELHLTNVTYDDAGEYICIIEENHENVTDKMTVIVRKGTKDPTDLKFALLSTIGCIVLLFLIIIALNYNKLELKYFVKKRFQDFKISDQPVTCLVYSDDAFSGEDRNPLRDVTTWLQEQNYKFYDPNNPDSYNDVGQPVVSNSRLVLQKCLSMTVIVTPNLLNDNTVEILNSYTGFADNVTRNFPVIFLCTQKMQKEVVKKAKADGNQLLMEEDGKKTADVKVYVTFTHFMKRNTVILWKADDQTKFHRSLYVALPKVRAEE